MIIYFDVFYNDNSGNPVIIASGSSNNATTILGQNQYGNDLYIPPTTLPTGTTVMGINIYAVFSSTDTLTLNFNFKKTKIS